MAEGKKSVLLYCDLIHTIEKMDDKTAGEFFKHYLRYINDLNPTTDNLLIDVTFESVKQNLKRDLKKWEGTKETKSDNGKIGNLKRWNRDIYDRYKKGEINLKESLDIAESRKASLSDKSIANIAVTDTVNVTVTDTVKDIKENKFNIFWNAYPTKTAKKSCLAKWHKLKDKDIEKILSTINSYVSYKPFKDYTHPNPMTYLNQERWNDVVPIKKQQTKRAFTG